MQLIYIYDFFRPDYKNAKRFFYDIISASVKAVFDEKILFLEDSDLINLDTLYTLSNFKNIDDFWVKNYSKLPLDAEEYLIATLPKDAIYFSHEAPDWLLDLYKKADLKFIDTRLSSIRFMRDISILLSTNISSIAKLIQEKYRLADEEITYEAQLLSAKLRFYQKTDNFKQYENSLIFIGQMHHDTAIMNKNNNFARIADYKTKLKELSKNYSKIFYKPHPYSKIMHQKDEIKILKEVSNQSEVPIINDNIYEIFTLPYAMHFVGLSSGVLHEAKFFNHESTYLLGFHYAEKNVQDTMFYTNVDSSNFFSPAMWQDFLSEFLPIKKDFSSYHYKTPNMLREHHFLSYDYGKLLGKNNIMFREMYGINKEDNTSRKNFINPLSYWFSLLIKDWKRYFNINSK